MLGVKAANQPKYDSADDRPRFGRYYCEYWQMVFMCVCAHGCIRSIVTHTLELSLSMIHVRTRSQHIWLHMVQCICVFDV